MKTWQQLTIRATILIFLVILINYEYHNHPERYIFLDNAEEHPPEADIVVLKGLIPGLTGGIFVNTSGSIPQWKEEQVWIVRDLRPPPAYMKVVEGFLIGLLVVVSGFICYRLYKWYRGLSSSHWFKRMEKEINK